MKSSLKKISAFALAFLMGASVLFGNASTISAATTTKVTTEETNITMNVGKTKQLHLVNKKSAAKYAYASSNTKVATVSNKGVITAKTVGTTVITVNETYKKKTTTIGKITVNTVMPKLTVKGTYTPVANGNYDDAACVDTIILSLDKPVSSVDKNDFVVKEASKQFSYETFTLEDVIVERTITDAYACDANGKKTDKASSNVAIKMTAAPGLGKPIESAKVGTQDLNVWTKNLSFDISLSKKAVVKNGYVNVSKLSIEKTYKEMTFSGDMTKFKFDGTFKAKDGVSYNYAYYTPSKKSDTLVVWLHGLGEGGVENTDPRMMFVAAEAGRLAGKTFQDKVGGANVLAPQCPTWWMDPDGKGELLDGTTVNSYYAKSLDELITSYAKKVGAKKIVLAGCSNGGYMTMVMAIKYPSKYAAIIPICEALQCAEEDGVSPMTGPYSKNDDQIKPLLDKIKDIPMYFVYSEDDPLVFPPAYEIPTIKYLKSIGAKDVHVSTTEMVLQDYGNAKYPSFGHASWCYFFNNTTKDENGVDAWTWLGKTLKSAK